MRNVISVRLNLGNRAGNVEYYKDGEDIALFVEDVNYTTLVDSLVPQLSSAQIQCMLDECMLYDPDAVFSFIKAVTER